MGNAERREGSAEIWGDFLDGQVLSILLLQSAVSYSDFFRGGRMSSPSGTDSLMYSQGKPTWTKEQQNLRNIYGHMHHAIYLSGQKQIHSITQSKLPFYRDLSR